MSKRRWIRQCGGWLLWLLCSVVSAWAGEEAIHYEVNFTGLTSAQQESLEPLLRAASLCIQEKESAPASRFVLLRRARKDHTVLAGVLQSRGYFAAQVSSDVDFTAAPVQVNLLIDSGPLYRVNQVRIEVIQAQTLPAAMSEEPPLADADESFALFATPALSELGLEPGKGALSRTIFAAEERLLQAAKKQGFAFAKLAKRQVVVDHDQQTVEVALRIAIGPRVLLGAVTLSGHEGISGEFLHQRIPWATATRPETPLLYQPQRMEEAQRALLATGLFNGVQLRIAPEADASGLHPVTAELSQRKHRSISSGVGYSTGTGAKIAANWEHRNLFAAGEQLQVKGQAAVNQYHLESNFTKPDFLQLQQKLLLAASLDKEDTEAFYKNSFGTDAGISFPLAPQVDLSYGVGYRLADEKDRSGSQQERLFGLFSTPVKLVWDRRDNLLDPSQGWYMNLLGAGIIDTLGTGVWFGKIAGQVRTYYPLLSSPKIVLAGRLGAGTISGSGRESVPADERFYSGGSGSLRGYGFQMAGAVDHNKKPLGGRSMVEFSTESRLQISESMGLVAFLDGGRSFVSNAPSIDETLLLGAGGGLRYKTPIGPLRLDIGVPLQRRVGIDDPYQLYVSIGQAF
ncbi:MAG: BamA/TamA family outer membrane protein [Magnetococcales bacterium]|nr:BamA/TamA family outer membrane protein [Magnetococcales bacterium]